MKRVLCFVIIVLVLLSGCGSKSVAPNYEAADEFILYSLDGSKYAMAPSTDAGAFHGVPVLGQTSIEDQKKRAELISALYDGINDSDGTVAACFIPRHGIHIVQGQQVVDYVICFECLQVEIYQGNAQSSKLTTQSPRKVFNKYLKDAGLPLAP